VRLFFLQWLHPLNWDEIEYFRATDWVRQGLVPYRDFWEHHTPLQWFVFAPLSALTASNGVGAILFMRWAQLPVWIATLWLLTRWMRRAGASAVAAAAVILLAVCSSMFMLAAVEYRIDALACFFLILGLVLLQRERPAGAGAAFALAVLTNLRLGPLVALALLLALLRGRRALAAWGAGATTLAAAALYFVATNSLAAAVRRVWTENYLGDRYSADTSFGFLHRLAISFGVRVLGGGGFDPAAIDLATIAIFALGAIGVVRALARWRARDDLVFLAILNAGGLLFIAAMKFVYHYHFLIVLLLLLPFAAEEIDLLLAAERWRLVAAGLIAVSAVNVFASLFRGKEQDLIFQNIVMREVHRRTRPDGTVFDGVGWAIRRRPAYRYWFLPELVRSLEGRVFEPYTPAAMISDPPAAIVTDNRALTWLRDHPPLAAYAVRHYVPAWRNVWVPGMSARLAAGESVAFIVPAAGTYRVAASPELASHPWFGRELLVGSLPLRISVAIDLTRIGTAGVDLPALLPLRKGERLVVTASEAVGLFIVPVQTTRLFLQPPGYGTLDAAAPPRTHIPFR
jgi:hypothetical protein